LDETGILRSFDQNSCPFATGRVSSLKPFYRAAKITAIGTARGAISINKVLAVMTMNDSMDGVAFAVFIEKLLCPQLWAGAVVLIDNLPAHKVASIVPIEALGASVIATALAVKPLCFAQLPLHPARQSNLISCLRIRLFNHDQHRSILLISGE